MKPFRSILLLILATSFAMQSATVFAETTAQSGTPTPAAASKTKATEKPQTKKSTTSAGSTPSSTKADDPTKPTEALSADQYVDKIQSFYNTTKDYKAVFVQTYTDIAAGTTSVAKGVVYIKQPGKMRWDYYKNGKREKLYVSDGVQLWAYEYGFDQAFKQCLSQSPLKTSLSFLMGSGDLKKEFNAKLHKKSTAATPWIRLQPKDLNTKFKEIDFKINPKDGQVVETILYDPYGNSNSIRFLKPKINTGDIPDKAFTFNPPKSVTRVLNAEQECK